MFKVLNTVRCVMLLLWRINKFLNIAYLCTYCNETYYVALFGYGPLFFAENLTFWQPLFQQTCLVSLMLFLWRFYSILTGFVF